MDLENLKRTDIETGSYKNLQEIGRLLQTEADEGVNVPKSGKMADLRSKLLSYYDENYDDPAEAVVAKPKVPAKAKAKITGTQVQLAPGKSPPFKDWETQFTIWENETKVIPKMSDGIKIAIENGILIVIK